MTERKELEQAIATIEAQRAVLGDEVVDTMVAAAREKLATLEAQRAVEQRKQVSVLFADVSGFTAMVEMMDPEEVRDTMNALWERMDRAIIAHEGTIDKHMGDAVMAIFGAPTAREDDPERAIRAALTMQKEIKEWRKEMEASQSMFSNLQSPISIRVGIHTGPVWLGAVATTAEYTAMGDTVNLAFRLQYAAPVGGVIVSHDTYRHVRGVFDVMPMESITVKGKREPIPVYVILRAKPRAFRLTSRGVRGIETRMVGREKELEQLKTALREVIGKRESQIVTIVGEAGVGKSRLLYEFDNWIALLSETVFHFKGRAREQTSNLPYFLIRDLLSFHFEIQDSDPASVVQAKLEHGIAEFIGVDYVEKAHFMGHLVGFDFSTSPHLRGILGDARQIRDRALYYFTQFFTAVSQRGLTIVFLEDIHWADKASLELIDHLVRECPQALLLIVCLARPSLFEKQPSWGKRQAAHTPLELLPLSEYNSHELVAEILRKADQIPANLRDMIVNRVEGNPFYVEEFIKALIEDGVITTDKDQWQVRPERLTEVRIPPTLVGVLQARLDRLPLTERELLQRASVVGRVFWDGALERIYRSPEEQMSPDETQATLEILRKKELLFRREESAFADEREYMFQHAILHSATYESVLKRLRRVYHAQVAAWLVERSGERVGEYAGLIGGHYEQAGKATQAAGWYGQAGKQARSTYAPEVAIGYYQKALTLLPNETVKDPAASASQRVVLYEGLGEMLLWQARYTEAAEACVAMRATAESSGDIVAQARAWNRLSRTQSAQGNYLAALESAEQAEALCKTARKSASAARVELAWALFRIGWSYYRLGNVKAALSSGERALTLSTKLDDRRRIADSLNLLGGVHSVLGNHGDAAHYNSRAVTLYQELGDQEGIGAMLNHLGEHAQLRGDYGAAVALHREALKIAYETGNRTREMAFLSNLGGARVGMGEYRTAEYDLRRIIQWAEIAGQGGWLSNTYRFLAAACLGQNRVDESLVAALRALSMGKEVGASDLIGGAWRVLGMIAARAAKSVTIGDRTLDAADCFAESAQNFATMGAEGERARTLQAWARHEMEQGNSEPGEEMWHEARSIFVRLGMELEVGRMVDWTKEKSTE
ncbi:MAG: AAA family ATPase [Chloroflexi bacterium]|nr:AAA family ATPase [Chloroflexota bacterium]